VKKKNYYIKKGYVKNCTDPKIELYESGFRAMCFHVAYNHFYHLVADNTLRFAYALCHSSLPIKDRETVEAWYKWSKGKTIKEMMNHGHEIPKSLKPIVNSYFSAIKKRAKENKEDVNYLL